MDAKGREFWKRGLDFLQKETEGGNWRDFQAGHWLGIGWALAGQSKEKEWPKGGFPAVLGIQLSRFIGRRSRRDRPTLLAFRAEGGKWADRGRIRPTGLPKHRPKVHGVCGAQA